MRKSRYTEEQITSAIKASESGIKVKEICDELGISEATFYSWKKEICWPLFRRRAKNQRVGGKSTHYGAGTANPVIGQRDAAKRIEEFLYHQ